MSTTKTYCYTVMGRGRFPEDMLRYDGAEPFDESDKRTIEAAKADDADPCENYSVDIRGTRPPTVARWNSFGWGVFDVDGVTPYSGERSLLDRVTR